jgi:hypothetical protein
MRTYNGDYYPDAKDVPRASATAYNHDSAARPVEHQKTGSAEQAADNFGAVVLNGLLADRQWQ